MSWLRALTYQGALQRYGPREKEKVPGAYKQIDYELDMIDKEALVACLRQAALGIEFSSSGSMRLDLTLSLLKWLSLRRHASTTDDDTRAGNRHR